MSSSDPTDRFKDIPALMNPTTPSLRRLRARLEGQTVVIPRKLRRKKGQTAPTVVEERRKNSEAHARRRAAQRVQVPIELVDPHPLIEQTREAFNGIKPDDDGILRPAKVRRLDINASAAQLDRALLIFDTLIKVLEQRGLTVEIAKRKPRGTWVTVAGRALTFSLMEVVDERPHKLTDEEKRLEKEDPWRWDHPKPPTNDHFPSGRLRLRLQGVPGVRGCWSDGMRYLVEDCLHHFLRAVREAPFLIEWQRLEETRLKQERAVRSRCHELARIEAERRHQEQKRREEELERQRQAELARIRRLDRELGRWQKAEALRAYINYREAAATPHGAQLLPGSELAVWLTWMRSYADRLDPTKPEAGEPLELPAEDASAAPAAQHYSMHGVQQRPHWFYHR